jgi:hypothetical protein
MEHQRDVVCGVLNGKEIKCKTFVIMVTVVSGWH